MENEKVPAILTHALGLVTSFVGPLVVYFIFRGKASPWLREHLDESLNYWILASLAFILLIILAIFIPAGAAIFVVILAVLIIFVAWLFGVISIVKAAMGKPSHYPLNIKLIK